MKTPGPFPSFPRCPTARAFLTGGSGAFLLLFLAITAPAQDAAPYAKVARVAPENAATGIAAPVISDAETSTVNPFTQRERIRHALTSRARVTPSRAPSWQSRYTLGPGDTLNFSMFDRTDLARPAVPIAPDGTVSYLQAVGVQARGKTIPELRKSIEGALSAYHRDPKVILTPAEIGSKRYTVIGRVREPGSFGLNRPTTVIEAIATAKGIEVGTVNGNAFELADLERSFVARGGRKLDIDLARLYHRGDVGQNAFLEPDDYIYVASSLRNEIYVLGEVESPGRLKMADNNLTVTRAILQAGSFTREAHKHNILLIRGSIHDPQPQIVSVKDVLSGKSADIPVRNRDIIFVSKRPFQILEKALDSAIFTFTQTVISESIEDAYISIPADVREEIRE